MVEIRWHGRGGQGAFTAAKILGAAALLENKFALSFPSFGPERRGAPIQAFTKIDEKPIINRSEIKECDYMIVLDETLFSDSVFQELKAGGKVIINSSNDEKYKSYHEVITIDGEKLAMEELNTNIVNTAMLGFFLGAFGILKESTVVEAASRYLPSKVLTKNKTIIEKAYKIGKEVKE